MDGAAACLPITRVTLSPGRWVLYLADKALVPPCLPCPPCSVPTENQSTAVGVVTAASYVGTALAFGLAPTLIEDLGWPVSCIGSMVGPMRCSSCCCAYLQASCR